MQIARTIAAAQSSLAAWRAAGQRIALVPTMGGLHRGHLSLVEIARPLADKTVASIFVNPRQFDRKEDFDAYPRTEASDVEALQAAGVDLVLIPPADEILPAGLKTVSAGTLAAGLCGAFRPGHFDGVATVVVRLFEIVAPDLAVFGQKDYQQACIVRELAASLKLNVEIISAPTVRDPQGLALSSRNNHLTQEQQRRAPALYRTLCRLADAITGARDLSFVDAALQQARTDLRRAGLRPEYLEIRKGGNLAHPASVRERPLVILAAAWLGKTRLIDNVIVE